ncbi:MAG: hypothetical protein ABI947_21630 [Chloroflexota bacterium]
MSIFSMVRKLVEGVTHEITKQKGNVVSQAIEPINGFINSIAGGVWVGPNADEFVNQLKQIIAELSDITGVFGNIFSGLGSSMAAIDAGDSKAANVVNDLGNVFSHIF